MADEKQEPEEKPKKKKASKRSKKKKEGPSASDLLEAWKLMQSGEAEALTPTAPQGEAVPSAAESAPPEAAEAPAAPAAEPPAPEPEKPAPPPVPTTEEAVAPPDPSAAKHALSLSDATGAVAKPGIKKPPPPEERVAATESALMRAFQEESSEAGVDFVPGEPGEELPPPPVAPPFEAPPEEATAEEPGVPEETAPEEPAGEETPVHEELPSPEAIAGIRMDRRPEPKKPKVPPKMAGMAAEWAVYWRGATVWSLLLAVLSIISGDLHVVVLVLFLSVVVFFPCYFGFWLMRTLWNTNKLFFILAVVCLAGAPLLCFVVGSVVLVLSRLIAVRRLFPVYLLAILVAAGAGVLREPEIVDSWSREPAEEEDATPGDELPHEARAAEKLLLSFADIMEVYYFDTESFSEDISAILKKHGSIKPAARTEAIAERAEKGDLRVRVREGGYDAAIRWADGQWWTYTYPKQGLEENPVLVSSPNDEPPFDAVLSARPEPEPVEPEPVEPEPEPAAEPEPKFRGQSFIGKRITGEKLTGNWARAREQIRINGIAKRGNEQVVLIGAEMYRKGDRIKVQYRGDTYTFVIADLDAHNVHLKPLK